MNNSSGTIEYPGGTRRETHHRVPAVVAVAESIYSEIISTHTLTAIGSIAIGSLVGRTPLEAAETAFLAQTIADTTLRLFVGAFITKEITGSNLTEKLFGILGKNIRYGIYAGILAWMGETTIFQSLTGGRDLAETTLPLMKTGAKTTWETTKHQTQEFMTNQWGNFTNWISGSTEPTATNLANPHSAASQIAANASTTIPNLPPEASNIPPENPIDYKRYFAELGGYAFMAVGGITILLAHLKGKK